METNERRTTSSLVEHFSHHPYEFDFYQAVKILEALNQRGRRFGEEDDPTREAFHIRSRISFSPASSDLYSLRYPLSSNKPPILTVNFFGLAGIQGPLPSPFTEILLQQERSRQTAFRDFLDIFNHRLLSAWYRIRLKMTVGLSQKPLSSTPFGKILYDLCGWGSRSLQGRLSVPDNQIVHFSPLLWQKPKSFAGLYQILSTYFNEAKIEIIPHVGKWIQPSTSDLSSLGLT